MHRAAKDKTDSRFCVVSFPDEEESLYIVSSKWLQHDRVGKQYICLWPPYKGDARIKRAVLNDEKPQSTWHKYYAKLIQKCKSYKGAENILNAIVTISNERSRLLHGSDSESNSHNPASKIIKIEHDESLSGVEICDQPSDSSSEEGSSAGILYEVSQINTPSRLPSSTPLGTASGTSLATTSTYHFLLDNTPVAAQTLEMTSTLQEGSYSSCTSLEEKIDFIAKSLESLKRTVEKNSEILRSLHHDANDFTPIEMKNLPIETIDDLANLNEKLNDDEEFTFFVKQLGYLGGNNQTDAVRRILRRLILNDVAVNCNWIGGYGKRSFKQFKRILQLVFVAVRQNREYSDATQASVENSVKRWLRCAADRNGGRTRRTRRNIQRIVCSC